MIHKAVGHKGGTSAGTDARVGGTVRTRVRHVIDREEEAHSPQGKGEGIEEKNSSNSSPGRTVITSGATECFVSQRFIDTHKLSTRLMMIPQKLQNTDGSPNAGCHASTGAWSESSLMTTLQLRSRSFASKTRKTYRRESV